MSKAYDAVYIAILKKTLKRIKIPEQITKILLSILNNRTNTVITCHGNTEEYKVEDGIDQGDTISPILWRIFYDSLLSRIQKIHTGYTITTKKCPDIRDGWKIQYHNIPTSTYMDDTTWIANNKETLQEITDIAEELMISKPNQKNHTY